MSFSRDMDKFCKQEAPDYLDRVVRITLAEISNRLVYRSPVGDASYWQSPPPPGYVGGRFRANWHYGFNFIPSLATDDVDSSGMATLNRLVSAVSRTAGVHHITNNLPYAQRIEEGWSRQAPQGIVGRIELEFPAIVRAAKAAA